MNLTFPKVCCYSIFPIPCICYYTERSEVFPVGFDSAGSSD